MGTISPGLALLEWAITCVLRPAAGISWVRASLERIALGGPSLSLPAGGVRCDGEDAAGQRGCM